MSPDTRQDQIQDYLDGRLSEAQRAAFEARLEREPDLARRVAEYRSIGQALREDPSSLSPGFYTRTRARFEAGAGGARRGFRLLSWETAGLSAAVVLAAAIFLPGLLRQDETLTAPATQQPLTTGDDQTSQATSRLKKEAPADIRGEEGFAAAPPPAEKQAEADKKSKTDVETLELDRLDADAPQPAPKAVSAESMVRANEPELEQEAGRRRQLQLRESAQPSVERGVSARLEESAPVFETLELPPGTVTPGKIRVGNEELSDRSKDQVAQKRFAATPSPGVFRDETKRTVLIGSRPGLLDCSSVSVEVTSDAYIIRIPSPGQEEDEAGPECAVLLPVDDREIRVLESGGDG